MRIVRLQLKRDDPWTTVPSHLDASKHGRDWQKGKFRKTPTQIARDALAGQMTPCDALVRIAGMEAWKPDDYPVWSMHAHADSTPAITDEVVDRCLKAYNDPYLGVKDGIRAALEEFVRQTAPKRPQQAGIAMGSFAQQQQATPPKHEWKSVDGERLRSQVMSANHPGKCGGPGVCWECDRGADDVRRATEQAARDAAMAAVREQDLHTTVYAQTADDEAGRVAWATGEPLNGAWTNAKIRGWIDAEKRWGKQEDVG